MSKRVLVVSSANMDFVMNMKSMPLAGQTVIEDGTYSFTPGGKGANSAVAFQRLGADCVFCARLGSDSNGTQLEEIYRSEGICTDYISLDDNNPTGFAAIMVEANGSNRIVVYPGANLAITHGDIDRAFESNPDALYMQFEICYDSVIYAANKAYEKGIPVFIDAGPAKKDFLFEKLPPLEVFSPNETETLTLTGINPDSKENCLRAAKALSQTVKAKYYVIKLGERGAYVWDGETHFIAPSLKIKAVDSTAAGDAFTAALTLEYLNTIDIKAAAAFANAVGALTVSRAGAYTSIPTRAQVGQFIK